MKNSSGFIKLFMAVGALAISGNGFAVSRDTLFVNNDTIFIEFNDHGDVLKYEQYLKLTDSIQSLDIELFKTDTSLAFLATKLYNTTVTLGREFLEKHHAYRTYYLDYLFKPCRETLNAYMSGSSFYSEKFDIYFFGNQFYHDRSRFKIIS